MKIAMVSEHANPLAVLGDVDAGGQNVHVAELSTALVRRGHEVTVYTRRDDPEPPDEAIAPGGYRVVHVPAGPPEHLPKDDLLPHMSKFGEFLAMEWMGQDAPDVVHGHFWMSGLAALRATGTKIPVVQTFHALGVVKRRFQHDDDTSPASRVSLEKWIAHRVHSIVATCSDEAFELMRMGVHRSKISIVPCGVDVDRFTPVGPRVPLAKSSRSGGHVVSVGRLVPRKGFGDLIQAVAAVPGAALTIVGGPPAAQVADDPEARRLMALADRLNVSARVRFAGRVSRADMATVLRSADVVACVPWYEPFGIVPLEAMGCGVPVVASAVGGLTDTVVDGVTGIHVRPRQPAEMATALHRLLGDRALRMELGTAGRDRVNSRYTWDSVARGTLRVYEQCVSEQSPADSDRSQVRT